MRLLWKAELMPGIVQVAAGANVRFTSAGLDASGNPCVWYESDVEAGGARSFVAVRVIATGEEVPPGHRHLGTFVPGAGLVFHAYVPDGT